MKRVSFSVAKALKEAGYKLTPAPSSFLTNETNSWYCEEDGELYSLPYSMEAWLWLWREKKISIELLILTSGNVCALSKYIPYEEEYSDPEEAIESAISYLVENKLLK